MEPMSQSFYLPDLGEGIAEGEVVSWLVEPGDDLAENQPLVEIETDKALVEIPSPITGTVKELLVEEGEMVPVGSELLRLDNGEEEPAIAETATEDVFARPSTRRLARELGVELEAIAGTGPGGRITEDDVRSAAASDESTELEEPAAPKEPDQPTQSVPSRDGDGALATPATRRLAAERGIDLEAVEASAEWDGQPVVTEADVRAYAEGTETTTTPTPDSEPYTGVRRTIGERMAEASTAVPHVTHQDTVDATRLVELRNELKPLAAERDINLTYTPFVMKAVVEALKEYPTFNASLDTAAEEIHYHDAYHVGVATDTEAGLMVPVIRDVDEKGVFTLASEIAERAARARDRSIDIDELRGGTFTVTNVGVIGGEFATPIVNQPEAAILALGAIKKRPWVVEDEVVPRHVLPLSLSFDHRIADGADAARFINNVKSYVTAPSRLLVD